MSSGTPEIPEWRLVYTRPGREQEALAGLLGKGFECFLPVVLKRQQHGGEGPVGVEEPLFPRYLFVLVDALDDASCETVCRVPGVNRFVVMDSEFASVDSAVVRYLQSRQAGLVGQDAQEVAGLSDRQLELLQSVFQSEDGTERSMLFLQLLVQSEDIANLKRREFGKGRGHRRFSA
jgi:transcriptional antiterminator RfaH